MEDTLLTFLNNLINKDTKEEKLIKYLISRLDEFEKMAVTYSKIVSLGGLLSKENIGFVIESLLSDKDFLYECIDFYILSRSYSYILLGNASWVDSLITDSLGGKNDVAEDIDVELVVSPDSPRGIKGFLLYFILRKIGGQ
ncbi:MAG: hypothetical protein QXF12_02120 [Candidatus Aenigmatarchaeota archaeon]